MTDITAEHLRPASGSVAVLEEGEAVEVRTRFDGRWVGGYRVAGAGSGGYLLTRVSDGRILPAAFSGSEVRLARCGPL